MRKSRTNDWQIQSSDFHSQSPSILLGIHHPTGVLIQYAECCPGLPLALRQPECPLDIISPYFSLALVSGATANIRLAPVPVTVNELMWNGEVRRPRACRSFLLVNPEHRGVTCETKQGGLTLVGYVKIFPFFSSDHSLA